MANKNQLVWVHLPPAKCNVFRNGPEITSVIEQEAQAMAKRAESKNPGGSYVLKTSHHKTRAQASVITADRKTAEAEKKTGPLTHSIGG